MIVPAQRFLMDSTDTPTPGTDAHLDGLLEEHRAWLAGILRNRAGHLLRYETVDDLVQDVHLEVLKDRAGFAYRSAHEFSAFLLKVALRHLGHRRRYWLAKKRAAGCVLRLSGGLSTTTRGSVRVAAVQDGPTTLADRRERFLTAMKCLEVLPPRDQDLILWLAEGLPVAEIAVRLELSYDAAKHARQRAIERFRKVYELAVHGGSS